MKRLTYLSLAITLLTLTALAQDAPKPNAAAKPLSTTPAPSLALTDAERKQLEPLQHAAVEANQELLAAADALDAAKHADVLAAAYRWKAALTAFKAALRERGNWIATTAKAKGCEDCELNLQTGEFQKAKEAK